MLRRFIHLLLPPRLKKFFYGDGVCVWHSPWSVEEIQERLKASLPAARAVDRKYAGIKGRVADSSLRLQWKVRVSNNACAPVFHGVVVADPATGGAIIQGVFSGDRIEQVFMGLWTGAIVLIGLLTFWTVLFPLFAWGLLWMGDGIMWVADFMIPNQEDHIRRYLSQVCAAEIPMSEIQSGPEKMSAREDWAVGAGLKGYGL